MREDQDEVIGRIVRELEPLPKVHPLATERVLARIAAKQSAEQPVTPLHTSIEAQWAVDAASTVVPHRRMLSLPWALSLAAAATVAGFLIRGVAVNREPVAPTVAVATPRAAGVEVVPAAAAASRARDETAVETQFVLARPGVKRVALVGDFNGWDAQRTPMVREDGGDLWSVSVPLTPGRHVYAFVVNDSVWTLDPRAARERDADYGRAQSVIVVGRP